MKPKTSNILKAVVSRSVMGFIPSHPIPPSFQCLYAIYFINVTLKAVFQFEVPVFFKFYRIHCKAVFEDLSYGIPCTDSKPFKNLEIKAFSRSVMGFIPSHPIPPSFQCLYAIYFINVTLKAVLVPFFS
jgi:hypothetical protein